MKRSSSGSARAALTVSFALALAGVAGCMDGPRNGDVISGPTAGAIITVSGSRLEPNRSVKVQILKAPDDPAQNDPAVNANWVTIGTAVSAETPGYEGTYSYYPWSVDIVPASAGNTARWPLGGILRMRAVDGVDGSPLLRYDHDIIDCMGDHTAEGEGVFYTCRSPFPSVAVVNDDDVPADQSDDGLTPGFLTRRGIGSVTETTAYYKKIGVLTTDITGPLDTLTKFKSSFGFGVAGSDEAKAVYYNAGDLGVGREMHCKSFQKAGMASPGRACFVSNYFSDTNNVFGDNPSVALAHAVTGFQSGIQTGAGATVAMTFTPPVGDPNAVKFMVYGGDGKVLKEVPLDNQGYNPSIPQNCIVCHGAPGYNTGAHTVTNARFLAFDMDSFLYSSTPGFGAGDQQDAFRKLNVHVKNAGPAAATEQLINGWYAPQGVEAAGATFHGDFIPPAFAGDDAEIKVYENAVKPSCRTCHASQSGLPFNDADAFLLKATKIAKEVCDNDPALDGAPFSENHMMPQAQVTARRFWQGPGRAYLAQYLGLRGSCRP